MTAADANTTPATSANDEVKAAQEVGMMFAHEYYTFLSKEPSRLHCFYNKNSTLSHGLQGENVDVIHGQQDIHSKILDLDFEDCKVLVSNVDCQKSLEGGIIIQVLGELSNRGGPAQKFAQTFFLAVQPKGFYVLNDIFRYLKDDIDEYYMEAQEDQSQQDTVQEELQEQETLTRDNNAAPEPEVEVVAPEPAVEAATATEPVVEALAVEAAVEVPEGKEKQAARAQEAKKQHSNEKRGAHKKGADKKEKGDNKKDVKKDIKKETKKESESAQKKETESVTAPASSSSAETVETPAAVGTTTTSVVDSSSAATAASAAPAAPVASATPAASAAPVAPTPEVPAQPPKPKTWANLAANNSTQWGSHVSSAKATSVNVQPVSTPAKPTQSTTANKNTTSTRPAVANAGRPNGREEYYSIYIKNVTERMSLDQLREAFSKFGTVKHLELTRGRICAFLDFTTAEAMNAALKQHVVPVVGNESVLAEERHRNNNSNGPNSSNGPQTRRSFHNNYNNAAANGHGQGSSQGGARGGGRGGSIRGGGAGGGAGDRKPISTRSEKGASSTHAVK